VSLKTLLLLSAASGALQFASLPLPGQGYLAWTSFVPLLLAVAGAGTLGRAAVCGLVSGMVRHFAVLIWIPPVLARFGGLSIPLAWLLFLFLIVMQSVFPTAACVLLRFGMQRSGAGFLLAFPLFWVALEYASNYIFFGGFPWLLTGYSQTEFAGIVQVADLTGVYGVSFLVAAVNAAVAHLWLNRGRARSVHALWPFAAAAALCFAALVYGNLALRHWSRIPPDRRVAMLQANLPLDEPESSLALKFREGYQRLARSLPRAIDLLVLPESPSPLTFQYDESYRASMLELARNFPLGMVFNNIAQSEDGPEPAYFNSAYFLDRDGRETARYDKLHLVPFGEYVPLRKLFFFAESITKDVSDFHPGSGYVTARLDGHPANAIICFEAVFPEISRRFARDGSELILNLTNDGWYGPTAAPYQHLTIARWRAVENRRYLLRAANSGISAVVDPTGRIRTSTGLLKEDICIGDFAFISGHSAYTRYGDWFSAVCAIISGLLLFRCLGLGHRRRAGEG
jgi:apolipoprotein N-acyltransferase